LATDGDADRIGAMDGRGQFVDPHRIMSLALKYLVEERGLKGAVVKTVSTTQMINRLAKNFGLETIETPVGFNYIADWMLRDDVLLGGEESMGLLLIEMVAAWNTPLDQLVQELLDNVGPAQYRRVDLRLARPISKDQMVQKLVNQAPDQIGGVPVLQVNPLDGAKYILEDDSWLLIRPSGTEPVLRVYAEGGSEEHVNALLEFGQKIAEGTD
jgi:phosphomannomutase